MKSARAAIKEHPISRIEALRIQALRIQIAPQAPPVGRRMVPGQMMDEQQEQGEILPGRQVWNDPKTHAVMARRRECRHRPHFVYRHHHVLVTERWTPVKSTCQGEQSKPACACFYFSPASGLKTSIIQGLFFNSLDREASRATRPRERWPCICNNRCFADLPRR